MKMVPGARFGRGVVIERVLYKGEKRKVRMLCDCGTEYVAYTTSVYTGNTLSCGCFGREVRTKHGLWNKGAYKSAWKRWERMIARCYDPADPSYKNYGGRGIKVCDRWRESFENFIADMGEPPKGMSIERINNDGNYCRENCRWATNKEQSRNKRNNHFYTLGDRIAILADFAEEFGVCFSMLKCRIRRGMTLEDALKTPAGMPTGPEKTAVRKAAEEHGIPIVTLRYRMTKMGMTLEEAIKAPKYARNK